ncbi:MAG: hypothetical protein RIQ56_147 [Candidatus Parcubacteria bacterium]|jgi:aspartyl/glutamyl-tRNA(Asn/Gln) amidotransferase C subunit
MSNPVVDIRALSKLARLEVSDAELSKLEKEIPGILSFVETIQKVSGDAPAVKPALRNVMREDSNPHEAGLYTEALLRAAPARQGNSVVVKQVLSKKA